MKKNLLKRQVTFGVILVIIGLSFLLNDFIVEKREKVFSKMNLELSELMANNITTEENTPTENNDQPISETPETTNENSYETYIGLLEIEKIGLSKGFYSKESSLNNVKFNIKILTQSNYPDEEKGNVIIIGHSGNYSKS